jgi:AAT family amino acid transporter
LIIYGATDGETVGFSNIYHSDIGSYRSLFSNGIWIIFTTMVMTLVNFQRSEIVRLAASETENPEINVPRACNTVAYRIILIYVIPLILLVMILPYQDASLNDSVFNLALSSHGQKWVGIFFQLM